MLVTGVSQNELWQEVIKPLPSVGRLCNLGQEIQADMANASQCFAKQLAVNPNSIQTMRRYSQYLLEVREPVPSATSTRLTLDAHIAIMHVHGMRVSRVLVLQPMRVLVLQVNVSCGVCCQDLLTVLV